MCTLLNNSPAQISVTILLIMDKDNIIVKYSYGNLQRDYEESVTSSTVIVVRSTPTAFSKYNYEYIHSSFSSYMQ